MQLSSHLFSGWKFSSHASFLSMLALDRWVCYRWRALARTKAMIASWWCPLWICLWSIFYSPTLAGLGCMQSLHTPVQSRALAPKTQGWSIQKESSASWIFSTSIYETLFSPCRKMKLYLKCRRKKGYRITRGISRLLTWIRCRLCPGRHSMRPSSGHIPRVEQPLTSCNLWSRGGEDV